VNSDHLALDLDAFLTEHMHCGDLDTGLTETNPERVWVTCSCSARMKREVDR
jgi:hypothetical protein